MKREADVLDGLGPAVVWGFFSRIAAVPRPSKKEGPIRQAVRVLAQENGLAVREDNVGNLVIEVPASAGLEGAPITVLQGHLDMVCEKNAETAHDFDRDPLRLILDREADGGEQLVRADGTTLGADNGIGLALALAAATSPEVKHGPLELLFTVDEESGMTGADALTPDSFRGRRLLNLDSEEDDVIYIGCAGGCDTTLSWDFPVEPVGEGAVLSRVMVSGLQGGHSGSDIHKNRGNAIKLLGRTLMSVVPEELRLVSMRGGQLRNAIPREAYALVAGPPESFVALSAAASAVKAQTLREGAEEDLSLRVEREGAGGATVALSRDSTSTLLQTVAALPHGVLGMHSTIAGLVETSNNLATVTSDTPKGPTVRLAVGLLARSSSASRLQSTLGQIAAVGSLAGARVATANHYPGWEPNLDSPVLRSCCRVYERLFKEEPKVTAIHAGLECGIIGERIGGMDMVSFGPRIEGAHSPDERVYVTSVQKSWRYLVALLEELARK